MCDPGDFRGKSLNVILLLLKKTLGNEHGKIYVLHTGLLEPAVEFRFDVLPNRVSGRLEDHAALYRCVSYKLCFFNDIRIPLGKVDIPRCNF